MRKSRVAEHDYERHQKRRRQRSPLAWLRGVAARWSFWAIRVKLCGCWRTPMTEQETEVCRGPRPIEHLLSGGCIQRGPKPFPSVTGNPCRITWYHQLAGRSSCTRQQHTFCAQGKADIRSQCGPLTERSRCHDGKWGISSTPPVQTEKTQRCAMLSSIDSSWGIIARDGSRDTERSENPLLLGQRRSLGPAG